MSKELLFFDSTYSTKIYDPIVGSTDANYYHPFNITHTFKSPLKNVKRITLKSVEMPLFYGMIRKNNDSGTISFTFTYNTFVNVTISATISPNLHTVSSLITAINNQISGVLNANLYTGVSVVLSTVNFFSNATSNLMCSITHNCSSFTLNDTPLLNILGFVTKRTSLSSPLQSTAPINLNAIDNCIYIQVLNIPVSNINMMQTVSSPFSFKIPFNNNFSNGSTLFFNDSTEQQSLYIQNPLYLLDKLDIKVVDRLGYQMTGYYNWTATFQFEYDEDDNNINQIEYLNINN